jgi:hypothetical protein
LVHGLFNGTVSIAMFYCTTQKDDHVNLNGKDGEESDYTVPVFTWEIPY